MSSLHRYYDPLRLPFRSLPFHRLAYRFALYGFAVRRRVSPVPNITVLACRSLYTGEFFRAAYPESSRVPWPSQLFTALGSLLSLSGPISRCGRIHLMLRPASLLHPHGFFTDAPSLGSRHQTSASYEAVWSLPRSDSHRQAMSSLAGRAEYSYNAILFHLIRGSPPQQMPI